MTDELSGFTRQAARAMGFGGDDTADGSDAAPDTNLATTEPVRIEDIAATERDAVFAAFLGSLSDEEVDAIEADEDERDRRFAEWAADNLEPLDGAGDDNPVGPRSSAELVAAIFGDLAPTIRAEFGMTPDEYLHAIRRASPAEWRAMAAEAGWDPNIRPSIGDLSAAFGGAGKSIKGRQYRLDWEDDLARMRARGRTF